MAAIFDMLLRTQVGIMVLIVYVNVSYYSASCNLGFSCFYHWDASSFGWFYILTWDKHIQRNSLAILVYGLHPWKLTCPPKRDHFNRKCIFQPLIFRGHVSFHLTTSWKFLFKVRLRKVVFPTWTQARFVFHSHHILESPGGFWHGLTKSILELHQEDVSERKCPISMLENQPTG